MPKRRKTLLTNLELEVMRSIWDAGGEPQTARDVAARMNAGRPRPLAYNTIQTMLTILRDKGVVASVAGPSRAHLYRARVTREEVSTSMVGDLVEKLFDGKVQPLLVHLVGDDRLSRNELERLRQLIDSQLTDEGPPR